MSFIIFHFVNYIINMKHWIYFTLAVIILVSQDHNITIHFKDILKSRVLQCINYSVTNVLIHHCQQLETVEANAVIRLIVIIDWLVDWLIESYSSMLFAWYKDRQKRISGTQWLLRQIARDLLHAFSYRHDSTWHCQRRWLHELIAHRLLPKQPEQGWPKPSICGLQARTHKPLFHLLVSMQQLAWHCRTMEQHLIGCKDSRNYSRLWCHYQSIQNQLWVYVHVR